MSASELYSRLLLPRKEGYPLFCPQLSDTLPEVVRRIGTEIGDVGVVNMYGAFDPIFNITREANNSANQFGVPVGFEPLVLGPHDIDSLASYILPGSDISNTTISKRRLDVSGGIENNVFLPAGVGAVVEVSTNSKETAILLLPDGASRRDLRPLESFRNYALTHAQSWYDFVNGRLRRMIGSGDLYLVTGVTKSTSWSVAAVENQSGTSQISLKLKAVQVGNAGASGLWEWETANSAVNSSPRRSLEEESWQDNQTVFVRGFKVAARSGLLRRPNAMLIVNSEWSDMKPKPSTSGSFNFSHPRRETNKPPQSSSRAAGTGASVQESSDYAPNVSVRATLFALGINGLNFSCLTRWMISINISLILYAVHPRSRYGNDIQVF
ncbi:hypothetical protein DFH09DRAFT_1033698 [Mycena vulgaris]|nr:hypothetical protein DFH09DRAFT_1033698 [Mycena vulgaris]